jgi:hypothetical protein
MKLRQLFDKLRVTMNPAVKLNLPDKVIQAGLFQQLNYKIIRNQVQGDEILSSLLMKKGFI